MLVKLTFFCIWLGLLGYTYQRATTVDTDLFGSGNPIASLAASAGEVQVRPIEFEIWNFVDSGQNLYEGNVLATGESSEARVSFDNGRDIVVGANTQIVLSQTIDSDGGELVVTLLKGSVSTEKRRGSQSAPQKQTLRLRSGTSDFVVKRNDTEVDLKKNVSSDRAQITVKTGQVEMSQRTQESGAAPQVKRQILQASTEVVNVVVTKAAPNPVFLPKSLPKPIALAAKAVPFRASTKALTARMPEVIPTSAPEDPPPQLAINAESIRILPPRIIGPEPGVYWHVDSIVRGKADAFPIRLASAKPQNNFLRISGTKGAEWIPTVLSTRATAIIKSSDMARVGSAEASGWELKLQGGATPEANSLKGVKTSAAVTFTFRSLADFGDVPVRANFQTMATNRRVQDWFTSQGELSNGAAKYSVVVLQGKDVVRLAPHLASSEKFSVLPAPLPETGLYIAKRNGLVAWVTGNGLKRGDLNQLRKSLSGDLVYKGSAKALIAAADRASLMAEIKKMSGDLYVLQKQKLTRVNRNLLVEKPVAAQFIIDNGEAFFGEAVDIVDVN